MKINEINKGELYIITMTGAEMSRYKEFFDKWLAMFENIGEEIGI